MSLRSMIARGGIADFLHLVLTFGYFLFVLCFLLIPGLGASSYLLRILSLRGEKNFSRTNHWAARSLVRYCGALSPEL